MLILISVIIPAANTEERAIKTGKPTASVKMPRRLQEEREDVSDYLFLRIHPFLFGKILKYLDLFDLVRLNRAVMRNKRLYRQWWRSKPTSKVLGYANCDDRVISVYLKKDLEFVRRLGLNPSKWEFELSSYEITVPIIRKTLEKYEEFMTGIRIMYTSSRMKAMHMPTLLTPYLRRLKSLELIDFTDDDLLTSYYAGHDEDYSLIHGIANECKSLVSLNLSGHKNSSLRHAVSDKFQPVVWRMRYLLTKNSRSLTSLTLKNISLPANVLNSLEGARIKQLTLVSATIGTVEEVGHCISGLVSHVTSLKLEQVWCSEYKSGDSESDMFEASIRVIERILQHCTASLLHVDFSDEYRVQISSQCINILSSQCPNLETLNIGSSSQFVDLASPGEGLVTDAAIILLSQRCRGLRNIDLTRQGLLSPLAFDAIFENCTHIKKIRCYKTMSTIPQVKRFEGVSPVAEAYFRTKVREYRHVDIHYDGSGLY